MSPSTRRAYANDIAAYSRWCGEAGLTALPATPAVVAAYLTACCEKYAASTLRRRVVAIARASAEQGVPLDIKDPTLREALASTVARRDKRVRPAAAITLEDIARLVAGCGEDLVGRRDRALLLIGFAGALRRSELVALEIPDLAFVIGGLRLTVGRSGTMSRGNVAEIMVARDLRAEICPVRAIQAWLAQAQLSHGPVFRKVGRGGTVWPRGLSTDGVRQVLAKRAAEAGLVANSWESISPHGLRTGFVTTAYLAGRGDEEIMAHTRHKYLPTIRRYIRRARIKRAAAAAYHAGLSKPG